MATEVISTTFKFKRGYAQTWLEKNPILAQGEPGFELDTGRLKVGNGIQAYSELDYIGEGNIFFGETNEDFPENGQENRLYIDRTNEKVYIWKNNLYIALTSGIEEIGFENIKQAEGEYIIFYGGSATDNI